MDILIERADGILTIAFNRPDKKNAITAAMYQAMADALDRGRGGRRGARHADRRQARIFTAGNDLEDFMKRAADGRRTRPVFQFMRRISRRQQAGGRRGGRRGGRHRHDDAAALRPGLCRRRRRSFSMPFVQLGPVPGMRRRACCCRSSPAISARPKSCCWASRSTRTKRCDMGIVNRVLPADRDAMPFARAQAAKLAALPAASMRVTRR